MKFKNYTYNEIDNVLFELQNNKAVIIPTDTVVGLLSKNLNLIYQIKNRSHSKKVVQFISDYNFIPNLNNIQIDFLNEFWPGPLTVVKDGVSYRIPDDKYLLYLIEKCGVLYCSSANISNKNTIKCPIDANVHFNVKKNYYNLVIVDEKPKNKSLPSTIVDIDSWVILRVGEKFDEITNYINDLKLSNQKNVLLIDKKFWKQNKCFQNLINYSFEILKLSKKHFCELTNQIVQNKLTNLLIATYKPDYWNLLSNKIKYLRSGIVYHDEIATLIKQHNNVQIAIFDLNVFDCSRIQKQILAFINTKFEGNRHLERIKYLIDYEKNN